MVYQVGDKVIHWTYGLGDIVGIEEKTIDGDVKKCYVVQVLNMMTWIPIDEFQQHSLRMPTPPDEFDSLFEILKSPGEELQTDRLQRRNRLLGLLKDGQVSSICQVVRDLTHFKRKTKLNDQEKFILESATRSLLSEWSYSLETPINQAQEELVTLLQEQVPG
jgi:RNA polymerase-interacting CarD/CdnL/TRCF family regulator